MKKGTIVLLTDFGLKDSYTGVLKGVILSLAPGASILDLTHGVEPQNIVQGAHFLKSSYSYFPKGSIFVCVVDPGVGTSREIVCVKAPNYFFIGPDNGLLTCAVRNQKIQIRLVQNAKYFLSEPPSSTFHGRDIMAPAAAHLLLGGGKIFSNLGPLKLKLKPLEEPPVLRSPKRIRGEILYFDHFGNAITNIHRQDASYHFWKSAQVFIKERRLGIVRESYGTGHRRLCALFNSFSTLELAVPCGSAERVAKLKAGDTVRVKG